MQPLHLIEIANVVLLIVCVQINIGIDYEQWSPRNSYRNDLFCSNSCKHRKKMTYQQCCCCESKTCNELSPPTCQVITTSLHIEYITADGESILIQEPWNINTTYFTVKHVDGFMRKFPQNLIQFKEIAHIDFSRNRITEIGNITFLLDLSELILEGNKLKHISNQTFLGLVKLRTINLSRNVIKAIDPNTISSSGLNIFTFDVSNNKLIDVDITNFVPEGPMCETLFDFNPIQNIVNEIGFTFNTSKLYGDGYISMKNTSITSLINWTDFGLNDYTDILKTIKYQLYYFGSKSLKCDCSLIPYFVNMPNSALELHIADTEKVTCAFPQSQQGKTLKDVYYNKEKWNELVCDLDDCPSKCHCFDQQINDQQIKKRIVVDCSSLGLSEMPDSLPFGKWGSNDIVLLLTNNSITRLDTRDYTSRIAFLDMTGNIITYVDNVAVSHMTPSIELHIPNNTLHILPKEFQYLDPDNMFIGDDYLQCTCDFLWAENWQKYKLHDRNKALHCKYKGNTFRIDEMTNIVTDCKHESFEIPKAVWIIMGILLGLLVTSVILYNFWYEIFILYRRCRLHILERKFVLSPDEMDRIFICLDGANSDTLQWATLVLVPYLKKKGFQTILPYLDFLPGSLIENETIEAVKSSRVYIVLLSFLQDIKPDEEIDSKSSFEFQFNVIWREFESQTMKKIIVVNFDQIESKYVQDRRLKALIRVGIMADFYDREESLLKKIRKHLSKLLAISSISLVGIEELNTDHKGSIHVSNSTDLCSEQVTCTTDTVYNNHSIFIHSYKDLNPSAHESASERNVFKRLNTPKSSKCNCKYRKCYLHGTITHGNQ